MARRYPWELFSRSTHHLIRIQNCLFRCLESMTTVNHWCQWVSGWTWLLLFKTEWEHHIHLRTFHYSLQFINDTNHTCTIRNLYILLLHEVLCLIHNRWIWWVSHFLKPFFTSFQEPASHMDIAVQYTLRRYMMRIVWWWSTVCIVIQGFSFNFINWKWERRHNLLLIEKWSIWCKTEFRITWILGVHIGFYCAREGGVSS